MDDLEKLLIGSQKANSILMLLLGDIDWLRSDEGIRSLYIVKHELSELEEIAEQMMWQKSLHAKNA